MLPHWILIDPLISSWLVEDVGRGDQTTSALCADGINPVLQAQWIAKEEGIIAGLPIAQRVFSKLNNSDFKFEALIHEGKPCHYRQIIAQMEGNLDTLLMGERVALNIVMRLSGIASMTHQYCQQIEDLPTKFVDTRKTTPGLRILEKYASRIAGAVNHRFGLDDALMLKDNHIKAFGSIKKAVQQVKSSSPYPLNLEVETSNLQEVEEAMESGANLIMLDNMTIETMRSAVKMIRNYNKVIKIEASGNINLETIREVALTGVDYISSSAPITRSSWLDLSMKML